jgi:hypothetical protein
MRKKVLITGGIIALFLLLSSSSAFAQSLKLSSEEISSIKSEISSGVPVRDVLKSHQLTMDQIRTALATTGFGKEHTKLTNTQIANIASKLGLDPLVIQSEINSGKTFQQIMKKHNITLSRLESAFGMVSQ